MIYCRVIIANTSIKNVEHGSFLHLLVFAVTIHHSQLIQVNGNDLLTGTSKDKSQEEK